MANAQRVEFTGPGIMIISGLIFGFFGFFYADWNTPGLDGDPLLFRQLLGWTLKIAAIAFLLCAGLTFAQPVAGNLVYAVIGVVSAVMFVVVAILDVADKRHGIMAYGPIVLLLFAAWNGYGSWQGIRMVLAARRQAATA